MDKITIIFTTRKWNPVSWFIRWCLPRSRFANSLVSHCLIVDGDYVIEANMIHGVRRVSADVGLQGLAVIKTIDYQVQDSEAGLSWARKQDGTPYDWPGAFGIALAPDRSWQDESDWFCFELAAATLSKSGRDIFQDFGHITGSMLMAIRP